MALSTGETQFNGAIRDGDGRQVLAAESFQKYSKADLAGTVATIKGTAARLGSVTVFNPDATNIAYVQLFDVASGTAVSLGTTTPVEIIGVPAKGAVTLEAVADYANGVKAAATTTATGSTGVPTAVVINARYR